MIISLPEPEPLNDCNCGCDSNYLERFSYFIIFIGSGIGWFLMGHTFADCCYYRNRPRPRTTDDPPILARAISQ